MNPALAAIGAALAVIGASVGIGLVGLGATSAIARQPESAARVMRALLIAAALIEGIGLFGVVVALILGFR